MPSSVGPNTFGEENLVFGYDLGDVSNSYKGEPTTNLITSGLPGYFGSGGETLYQERLYGLKSDSGVFQRNYITNPSTGNNGGLYKAFTTSALSSTTRYVQISFDFYLVTRYRTASSSTTGLNGYLRIQNTDGLYDNYGWDTRYSNGSSDDWNNDIQYEGKWQKVSLIAALRSDKTPSSINAMYIYYDFFTQGEGIFTNFIITETPTLPTGPVRYTAGTRSATQGLIDITGNSTIDLTNVSFDSNAQMTFDGTDDTVALGDSSQFNITDSMSVFAWIKPDSIAGWKGIFGGATSGFVHFQLYNGGINVYVYGPAAAYGNPDSASIGTNVWTNVGFTFGGNTLKVYLNGEQLPTTVTGNGANISSNSDVRFGWAYATSRLFQGKINALTVHNRALTAEEVASNFNAIKSRFSI